MSLNLSLRSIFLAAALSLLGAALSGCGSSSKTSVDATTTGEQLTDLKKALDEGVITQKEYDHKRKEILEN